MRYPVTILLIIVLGLQTFSKYFIVLNFEINKDYITKNICINRFQPHSCCQGKCFLNKQLEKNENQQQLPGKENNKQAQVQLFAEEYAGINSWAIGNTDQKEYSLFIIGKPRPFFSSRFHPPRID